MPYSALLFLLPISCAVVLTLLWLTLRITKSQISLLKESHQNQIYFLERTVSERNQTIQNLMDRLMSEDIRTYKVMSSESRMISDSIGQRNEASLMPPISMSDESEVARMAFMNPGLGDTIYDDETLKFASDMGIVVDEINHRGGRT